MQFTFRSACAIGAMSLLILTTLVLSVHRPYGTSTAIVPAADDMTNHQRFSDEDSDNMPSNSDAPYDFDFFVDQEAIQARRRDAVSRVCQNYGGPSRDVVENPPFNIIVDKKHKLMFCFIPKVACTSWKRIFLVLRGLISHPDDISQFNVNHHAQKYLDFLKRKSIYERKYILQYYTKFMIARDPLSRVLSAYKNKLAPDSSFLRAQQWQKKIGTRIIERYRDDETPSFDGDAYNLTFAEFVRFLGEDEPLQGQDNKHWEEIYKMCLPCDIRYDIISKFETLQTDADYILHTAGIQGIQFPSANGSSPTHSSRDINSYYDQIPTAYVRALYLRYKMDFDLFGYDPPNNMGIS